MKLGPSPLLQAEGSTSFASFMKRILHALLLIGALIGLFGQQAAYAAGAHMVTAPVTASQMSEDCMEMMQEQQPDPAKQPCKGLTLDCIAAMGCVAPIMLGDPAAPTAPPHAHAALAFWSAIPVLAGSELPPEQHPPTNLG